MFVFMWRDVPVHMDREVNLNGQPFKKILYVYGYFACLYVCTKYVLGTHRGQKRALDPLELEFKDSCKLPCGY